MPARVRSGASASTQSRPKQPKVKTLQFVNVSDFNQTKDIELKRFVRANAMRYSQRKKKEQKQKQSSESSPTSDSGSNHSVPHNSPQISYSHGFSHDLWLQDASSHWPAEWEKALLEVQTYYDHLSLDTPLLPMDIDAQRPGGDDYVEGLKEQHYCCSIPEASPRDILGSGNEDPFNALPVDNVQQPTILLHHCMFSLLSNTTTVPAVPRKTSLLTLKHSWYSNGAQVPTYSRNRDGQSFREGLVVIDNSRSAPFPSHNEFCSYAS